MYSSVVSVKLFILILAHGYVVFAAPSLVTQILSIREDSSAVPVHAEAGVAYGPPSTPTVPYSRGDGFRIGGPPELPIRSTDQPDVSLTQDPAYEARSFDLPFLRNFKGAAKFYRHLNDPKTSSSSWGPQYDGDNQTACGIPTNAYWLSGVAIHPYFLKYAGLDRRFSVSPTEH